MKSERFNGKLAVLGFLGLFCLTGCWPSTYILKPDFYRPTVRTIAKNHLTINIQNPADSFLVGFGGSDFLQEPYWFQINYKNAFDVALKSELDTLFDHVTEGAKGSDLEVTFEYADPESDPYQDNCQSCAGVFGFTMEIIDTKSGQKLWSYKGRALTKAQEKQFYANPQNPEELLAILRTGISASVREISECLAVCHLDRYQLAPGEERSGDSALASGDIRLAFDAYRRAARDSFVFTDLNLRVKEKLLKLIPQMRHLPPVSDDARDHAGLGKQLLVDAKDQSIIEKAVLERELAIQAAPWWLNAYYNLAVTQAAAKHYQDAIDSMNLYLSGDTNPADIHATKELIYSYQAKINEQGE